jgi:hypothetical protein
MDASVGLLARAKALANADTRIDIEVPPDIRLARTDFSVFCKVMGKPNARHHEEWVHEFVTEETSSRLLRIAGADTAILAPRGSAKSTVLALFTAWAIGIHSEARKLLRILYISYALDIARSKSFQIKQIINSKPFREVFPTVRLGKDRTSDELWAIDMDFADVQVDADDPYTLCASGLGGAIVSRRADLIVIDDAIKSVDSISNPDIRAKLITNWQQVVRPCLLDGGRCIALGTRFSAVDIYGTTFVQKNGWRVIVEKAILTDGDGLEWSYWPEMWSLPYLQKLRRESPTDFSFQFQNLPVAQSELNFPETWFVQEPLKRDSGGAVQPYDMLCVGVDLSSGLKERNDYTVMLLGGIRDGNVEMISYQRMRAMGNLEKLDALLDMLEEQELVRVEEINGEERWHPTDCPVTVLFEEISYQQSIRGDAKAILHDKRGLYNIVLRGVKGYRGDKLSRFRGTLGLFQTGKVTWNPLYNWDAFKDEMVNFGYTDHDDCVDATVLTIRGLVGQGALQAQWGDWDLE